MYENQTNMYDPGSNFKLEQIIYVCVSYLSECEHVKWIVQIAPTLRNWVCNTCVLVNGSARSALTSFIDMSGPSLFASIHLSQRIALKSAFVSRRLHHTPARFSFSSLLATAGRRTAHISMKRCSVRAITIISQIIKHNQFWKQKHAADFHSLVPIIHSQAIHNWAIKLIHKLSAGCADNASLSHRRRVRKFLFASVFMISFSLPRFWSSKSYKYMQKSVVYKVLISAGASLISISPS